MSGPRWAPSTAGASDGDVLSVDSTSPSGVSWITPSGGGGGGDSVTVNGAATTDADLDDADPAAPAGSLNVKWQLNTATTPDSVSAYVKTDNTSLEISSAAIRRAALTGDVTAAAGSNATTIANDAVTDVKLRNSSAVSVIGRSANSSGDPADIAAGANSTSLSRTGDALSFVAWSTILISTVLALTDAIHPTFGSGQDGSVTYSGGTTLTEEVQASSITINSGVTVVAAYPIRCTGTLTFTSSTSIIDNSGSAGAAGVGGAGASSGLGSAMAGANGANGRTTTATGIAGTSRTNSLIAHFGITGTGGAGGISGLGQAGGGGGGVTELTNVNRTHGHDVWDHAWSTNAVLNGGGGGGSGGCNIGGGATTSGPGGGGAGVIVICARQIAASGGGTVRAKGGAGGNASGAGSAGGGGGGQGGAVLISYTDYDTLPTIDVAGGAGGNGIGSGGTGVTGSTGYSGTRRVL